MVVPELNAEHINIIPAQRKRLGTKRGFIAVKSNCSLQSYVPALFPLQEKYPIKKVLVCTYQAISGAGKTFETCCAEVYCGGRFAHTAFLVCNCNSFHVPLLYRSMLISLRAASR